MTMVAASAAYHSGAQQIKSRLQAAILGMAAAAIFAGIFFRTYHLDAKTFWGDELVGLIHTLGYTEAEIVQAGPQIRRAADIQSYFNFAGPRNAGPRSLSATVRSLASEDPQHPPVFYLMQRVWAAWAGVTPATLRTLPMIFGLLSIGAMAWLAMELFRSRGAAILAASLYAISPFAVLYAQEARETTLWALETLAASALLLRAARSGSGACWLAYAITCGISLYTYPLAAVVMIVHCAVVATSPELRKRVVLLPYLLASAAATVVYLPWLSIQATSQSGIKALGVLLANDPSALGVILTFMRDLKATVVDVGMVEPGTLARMSVTVIGTAILGAILYSLARLATLSVRQTASRFILALFIIPALPSLLVHGGALVSQLRYLQPSFIATQLAVTALFCAAFTRGRSGRLEPSIFAAAYVLILTAGFLSCCISARADTWYVKAYQRSPKVAAIINYSEAPLVVGDEAAVNDRGTSRVLEIGYSLAPDVAMRVNLRCEACLISPPPPIDVFADADNFRTVFTLGKLKRDIPEGRYTVRQIGIDINPAGRGPLEMFEPYPR